MERTFTVNEVPEIAQELLANTATKRFFFYGEMGVGKTTLIKQMIRLLGVQETVSSPTYSIINEYRIGEEVINHFDFYRIQSVEEVLDMGIEEYFESDNWLFLEWPEKIKSILPDSGIEIHLHKKNETIRTLKTTPVK